jgi:nitroreductase
MTANPLPATRPVDSETIEVLMQRVSVRRYLSEPVAEEAVRAVLAAAFRAPTSSNIQAYSVIQVSDPAARQELAAVAAGQQHIVECPVYLAFCADLTRIEHAMALAGNRLEDNNLEMGLVSTIDAALVGMSAYVAADSIGLKGVMIGAMRNDPEAVARILGLPHRVYCVFGMCLGYADESPPQKPRFEPAAVVHREQYDASDLSGQVERYDAALRAHYVAAGRTTNDNSWTHEVNAKMSAKPRQGLRAALARMGFDFL